MKPRERKSIEHKYAILGNDDATVVSYRKKHEDAVSYSVIRGKFDRWMAEEAKKEGVILVEETVVRELIVENETVVGILYRPKCAILKKLRKQAFKDG